MKIHHNNQDVSLCKPRLEPIVAIFFTLFDRFQQEQDNQVHYGHHFEYETKVLSVLFVIMVIRRIITFKSQHH
jgi:hypothetical protein